MIDRSIGIEIGKPVTFGVMTVHVRVADVVIVIRGELGFDLIELVLQDGERDGNAVLGPDAPLIADGPVRAASHDVSHVECPPQPLHGDVAWRVADLERPVYVETDELGHWTLNRAADKRRYTQMKLVNTLDADSVQGGGLACP